VLIQGNTFRLSRFGISFVNTQNLVIRNNTITVANAPSGSAAIDLFSDMATPPMSATIANNVLDTGGAAAGILIGELANSAPVIVTISGNDLHNNQTGINIAGDGTDLETVNIGDGTASSPGGNNFRGFTAAGAAAGSFAIYQHNTPNAAGIPALNNLWSAADPNTVIKDGTRNTTAGGGDNGTGSINVGGTQLTAAEQFVQTLSNNFLARSGSLSELDQWVSALAGMGQSGVTNAIIRSTEALKRVVDGFYFNYLGRPADAGGEIGWIGFLQQGGSEERVITAFVTSAEYLDRAKDTFGGFDSSYIQSLYNKLLGRNAGAAEIATWVSALPSVGRDAVVTAFLGSAEFRNNAIIPFVTNLLHRPNPAPAERAGWVNSSIDILSIEVFFASTVEYYQDG